MKKFIVFILLMLVFYSEEVEAASSTELPIKSEAAILVDSESGAVLYDKNGYEKMYPASLTKIATAIYALEKGNINDEVIISKTAVEVEGTKVFLNEGEVITLKKLIQGMLINSGNDAAMAIAEHLNGDVGSFSEQLNLFLKNEIGVHDTHFVNPHGLFNEEHYTTAYDLAAITNYALKNTVFKEIFGTKELDWKGQSWDTTIFTHHRLLKGEIPYEGITGGKTGFVNESKQTLASTAENENIKLTAILLKADYKQDIYQDTTTLLDFGFSKFTTTIIPKGKEYQTEEKKYVVEEDTFVTEDLAGSTKNVTDNGELQVLNQDGELLQTIQLKSVENKAVQKPKTLKEDQVKKLNMNPFFGFMFLAAVIGAITLKKKRFSK